MKTIQVKKSSFIDGLAFSNNELIVKMKSGKMYKYKGVQKDIAVRFTKAESYGKFYNTHIKDQYESEEMN